MESMIRWEGESAWEGLAELHELDGVELRVTEMPDTMQLNNELAASGALGLAIGFAFAKLASQAVLAVRDVLVKHIERRRGKVKVKVGKSEIVYEGEMSEKQRDQMLADLQRIASELNK